jgi:hypothetical protein
MSEHADLGWCILELMGHRRLGGFVTEEEIGGTSFLRIDVPSTKGTLATQYVSAQSIYCITPTTEAMARAVAQLSVVAPVKRWELLSGTVDHPPDAVEETEG